MKRKAFTLIEIMIVVLLISILLAIAAPQLLTARQSSQQTTCDENRRKLLDAKQMWIMNSELNADAAPGMADLVPDYIKRIPMCPTKGKYDLTSGGSPVTCTNH